MKIINPVKKLFFFGMSIMTIAIASSCQKPVITKRMFYGNVITLDSQNTKAQAVGVDINTGKIYFVGSNDQAKKIIDNQTEEINDYKDEYIYPGFVDAHNHPGLLGSALAGGCLCSTEDTNEQVFEKLNKYIDEHPNYEFYKAYGAFVAPKSSDNEQFKYTWKSIKENVRTDKPVLIADYVGHSGCFNDVALDYLKYYLGMWRMSDLEIASQIKELKMTDTIQLSKIKEDEGDNNEYIDGNVAESPFYNIYFNIPIDREELKEGILMQQEAVLAKMGYTTIGDCAVKCDNIESVQALSELGKEGKLKFKIRSYFMIMESDDLTAKQQVEKVLELKKQYDNDYFKIIGVKFFIDGISDKETCWTKEKYVTNPFEEEFTEGYYGVNRWDEYWRPIMPHAPGISDIVGLANTFGLSATVHAFADQAVEYALDEFEKAKSVCSDFTRNSIAHCAYVDDEDIGRFKELGVIPVVAPHWSARTAGTDKHEANIFGEYKDYGRSLKQMFKIKSFLGEDGKNRVAFHTDGMCPEGVPYMLYTALNRVDPYNADPSIEGYLEPRDADEDITLEQALECSTKSPAYLLNEDNDIGSIEIGKCGDFSIYSADFTNVDNFKQENFTIAATPLTATYLNGKIAYKAISK